MDGNESPWARPPQSEPPQPGPAAAARPPEQQPPASGWYGQAWPPPPSPPPPSTTPPSTTQPSTPPFVSPPAYQQPYLQPQQPAPYQSGPYQSGPYRPGSYQPGHQQAPYQPSPYQPSPYQPSPAGMPAGPRKRIGRQLLGGIIGVVVLGLVGVAGGWAISPYLPGSAVVPSVSAAPPSPAAATGQPSATPSATSSGNTHPTSGPSVYSDQSVLAANPLYAVRTTPLECAGLKLPIPSGKALEPWAKKAVSCLHQHYEPIVEEAGFELTVPTITFFADSIDTPCGEGSGAFYCGANEGIYVERGVYDTDARDRLNTIRMLLHEFSHHVQQRVGILDAGVGAEREDYPVVSRRIELQVSCWTGMQLRDSTWLKWTDDDEAWLKEISSSSSDKLHGSARSRRYWYDQSVGESTFGACNTWAVDASKVD